MGTQRHQLYARASNAPMKIVDVTYAELSISTVNMSYIKTNKDTQLQSI